MASSQFQANNRRHIDGGLIPKFSRFGGSKAQLCLQKIIHTILTVPGSNNDSAPTAQKDELPAAAEAEDPQTQSPAATVDVGGVAIAEEPVVDGVVNKEIDGDRSDGGEGGGDCMGLLIEAATLIFGKIDGDDERQETESATAAAVAPGGDVEAGVNVKRRSNERWTVDLYGDMEPVVRSKRGRTQVLPCKYRDSVIEPLTRVSKNRATLIPNKRRLR